MKIAICFSGQMRNYEYNIDWLDILRKHHNVDVYVHTWSNRGASTALDRSFPPGFSKFVSNGMHNDRPIGCDIFTQVIDKLQPQLITYDALNQLYKPKQVIIEELPTDYDSTKSLYGIECPKGITNHRNRYYHNLAMFYKIWACDQLRQNTESQEGFTYDLVVRVRPDHHVTIGDLSFFNSENFEDDNILYSHNKNQAGTNLPYISDQYAYGNSVAMKSYCSVWPSLADYWNENNYSEWPIHLRVNGLLVHKHLEINNISVRMLPKETILHILTGDEFDIKSAFDFAYKLPNELHSTGLALRNEVCYEYTKQLMENPEQNKIEPLKDMNQEEWFLRTKPLVNNTDIPNNLFIQNVTTFFRKQGFDRENTLTALLYLAEIHNYPIDIDVFEEENRDKLMALASSREGSAITYLMRFLKKRKLYSLALPYAEKRISVYPSHPAAYLIVYEAKKNIHKATATAHYIEFCKRCNKKSLTGHGVKLAKLLASYRNYTEALKWLYEAEKAARELSLETSSILALIEMYRNLEKSPTNIIQ
jgi:hypothetical protein